MRALVCHQFCPPEQLVVEDVPDLVPDDNQILVQIHAAGVNFTDVLSTSGRSQLGRSLPMTPGVEAAGVIKAIGRNVTSFKPGQRVLGHCLHGAMAEYGLFQPHEIAIIPHEMTMQQAAAFFIVSMTTFYAFNDRARLKAGETLLVLGAGGGAGLAGVQMGKAMGARVVAAASSEEKLDLAREAGADATVLYPRGPLDLAQQKALVAELLSHAQHEKLSMIGEINAVSDSAGYNVIYDGVGGSFTEAAMRALAWEGRYLSVGFAAGVPKVSLGPLLFKNADILGIQPASPEQRCPGHRPDMMDQMFAWFRAGKLYPMVSQAFDLEDAPLALASLADRTATGRVVIVTKAGAAR